MEPFVGRPAAGPPGVASLGLGFKKTEPVAENWVSRLLLFLGFMVCGLVLRVCLFMVYGHTWPGAGVPLPPLSVCVRVEGWGWMVEG